MAMSVAALEILEQAQFSSVQARAIARVLEVESIAHRDELATKADLSRVEARLEVRIENAKGENMRWTFLVMIGQVTLLAGIMYFLLQSFQ